MSAHLILVVDAEAALTCGTFDPRDGAFPPLKPGRVLDLVGRVLAP